MFRPPVRSLGLFLTASTLLLVGLPAVSAAQKSAAYCGWDTATGWVARENVKVGNAGWDHGIPIEYAGDFAGKEIRKRKGGPFSAWLAPSVSTSGPEVVLCAECYLRPECWIAHFGEWLTRHHKSFSHGVLRRRRCATY
jgi:hypothetical protein